MNHTGLDAARWARFTLTQQLLQVAVEMSRGRSAIEAEDWASLREGTERVLRLADLTSEVGAKGNLRRELRRWRYLVAERYADSRQDQAGQNDLLRALLELHPETIGQVEYLCAP